VTKTKLGFGEVVILEAFEKFSGMKANASDDVLSFFGCITLDACRLSDISSKCAFRDTEYNTGLFGGFREVEFDERF